MKKLLKTTALSLALASSAAMAAENIAFINATYLFQHHPEQAVIAQKIEGQFKAHAEQLAASKKKIEGKIASLEKEAKKLRSADIKKREDEIKKLVAEHDEKVAKYQQELQRAENAESAKLAQSILAAANNLAKEKGYTYVIDANSVVFAAEGKDITEQVLKALSAKPAEETKAAESAEPAKAK